MELFQSADLPLTHLEFTTRTPRRLFEALDAQTQLTSLKVKWGDYDDLSPLRGMEQLKVLRLGGASSIRSLSPLSSLEEVSTLQIESLRHVHDLSPIASMTSVTDLELGGDWRSPRVAHVDSIRFLTEMPQVRRLVLHTLVVDDADYSPILTLPNLGALRVMKTRTMNPQFSDLTEHPAWSK